MTVEIVFICFFKKVYLYTPVEKKKTRSTFSILYNRNILYQLQLVLHQKHKQQKTGSKQKRFWTSEFSIFLKINETPISSFKSVHRVRQ